MSVPMPEDLSRDLAADLALCREATPGPWTAVADALGHWRILWPHSRNGSVARKGKVFSDDDATFIAAAREGWPAALRRALAAEAELARCKDRLARWLLAAGADLETVEEDYRRWKAGRSGG